MLQVEGLLHQYSSLCVDLHGGRIIKKKQGEKLVTAPLKDFDRLSQNGSVRSNV